MSESLKVTVKGARHTLQADANIDGLGARLVDIDGWWTLPASKTRPVEQPSAHGAFPLGTPWRESHVFEIRVEYQAENSAAAARALEDFMALGAEEHVLVTVFDHDGATWRECVVPETQLVKAHEDCSTWEAVMSFIAVDPRRYGRVESRRETLAAGGSQYNLAAGGKGNNKDVWRVSYGAGHEIPPVSALNGTVRWLLYGSQTNDKTAIFFRIPKLLYRVNRVRLKVQTWNMDMRVRLNLSWLKNGVLRQVDAFTPQLMGAAGRVNLIDQQVRQPAGVNGLTVAVEQYDPTLPAIRAYYVSELMVGAFTDEEFQDGDSLGWAWLGEPGKSASAQLGTRWPLDNRVGTAPSTPAITVTAKRQMPGGFTLNFYGSEDKLVYSGDIPAGAVVELVPGEHAVLIDGKLSPIVAVGRWPAVPPGELVQLSLTANASTDFEATATWSPAWW